MRKFNIPEYYKSPIISKIKSHRREIDKLKKDFTPTILNFDSVEIIIPRHFGFCFGVENAIEIVYRTIAENDQKRIFLLSEMIHNPTVNEDLLSQGIQFLQDNNGTQLIPWSELTADDIVLIPAFGTTLEIEAKLKSIGVSIESFNTTCPFVEKVWKRSKSLGESGYTVVVHGKASHEETRATFSHSAESASVIIVENIDEAKQLGAFILGNMTLDEFKTLFKDRLSTNFNPKIDLKKLGVVNQTTMLATDTMEISDYLKHITEKLEGNSFADTRDTLCYATLDNQRAVNGMLDNSADVAFVIGGYNSSNTSHLVELCAESLTTYFINSADCLSKKTIEHYDLASKKMLVQSIDPTQFRKVMITSGASCPDAIVDSVIEKLISFFPAHKPIHQVLDEVIN